MDTDDGEFRASCTIRDIRLSRYRKKVHRAWHFWLFKYFCKIRARCASGAASSMKEATRVLATLFGITGISQRNDGRSRGSPSTADVFPMRWTTDKSVHSTHALFNKNPRTSFERSSLCYNDSYVPIGRTYSGDDAASRFLLAVANGKVNGCSRGSQSRGISAANCVPCREFFWLFSNLGNCESPSYRPAIADRVDRYYVDIPALLIVEETWSFL